MCTALWLSYLWLAITQWWSCSLVTDPYVPPAAEYDYFPLAIGDTQYFHVDSILFDTGLGQRLVDTVQLEVRQIITDTFSDQLGRLWYRYQCYERYPNDSTWSAYLAGTYLNDGHRLIQQEANLQLVLLVFPLSENTSWPPTTLINDQTQVYIVRGGSIHMFKGRHARILPAPDTAQATNRQIRLAQQVGLIEYRYTRDTYARGIGLIRLNWTILDSQNLDANASWPDRHKRDLS